MEEMKGSDSGKRSAKTLRVLTIYIYIYIFGRERERKDYSNSNLFK